MKIKIIEEDVKVGIVSTIIIYLSNEKDQSTVIPYGIVFP